MKLTTVQMAILSALLVALVGAFIILEVMSIDTSGFMSLLAVAIMPTVALAFFGKQLNKTDEALSRVEANTNGNLRLLIMERMVEGQDVPEQYAAIKAELAPIIEHYFAVREAGEGD